MQHILVVRRILGFGLGLKYTILLAIFAGGRKSLIPDPSLSEFLLKNPFQPIKLELAQNMS
jgi:hypothetical protein